MTASAIYLGIFAVGFLVLVFSMLFGGGHDADVSIDAETDHDLGGGGSPSILSLKVISCFLVGFGMGATISHTWLAESIAGEGKVRYFVDLGLGLGCGFLMGLTGWWIIKALLSQQAHYQVTPAEYIGITSALSLGIPEHGIGEINFELNGRRHSLSARSQDGAALPTGTMVRVVQMTGNTAIVEKVS